MEEIETICPIYQKPVRKIKEIETEEKKIGAKCVNEYYIHTKTDILIKILNPNTLWS